MTGSSSGIGRGIARMLGAEGAVVVHGRDAARTEAIGAAGCTAHAALGDLAAGAEAVGGLDILVNNICETEATEPGTLLGWPADIDARQVCFMNLGIFPCALQRYGKPEDIGTLVAFFASPLAGFANGANGTQAQSVN